MNNVQIEVSAALHEKLAQAAEQRGIGVQELAEQLLANGLAGGEVYQPHDEEKIKERLQSLGYID